MEDWLGLLFFLVLAVGAVVGLKALSKKRTRTTEDFERGAAEGKTALGATMNALQEIMDPAEARAKETIVQMKEGRHQKKKDNGGTDGS